MTREDDKAGYSLLLAFDSDDPEFSRGFEAGRLWERMKADQTTWDQIVHASNAEMVMRMAEACEREFRGEALQDGWFHVWID